MQLINLYETLDPSELGIIKASFANQDIPYRILNEHTLQVASAYALGNNGAVFQVHPENYEAANNILLDLGIKPHHIPEQDQFKIIRKFTRFMDDIPLLNQLNPTLRLLLGVFLLVATPFLLFILYLLEMAR